MPLKATPELFLPSEKAKLCTTEEFEKAECWDSGQPVLAPGFSCASFMFPLLSLPVPLSLPVLTPLGSWVLGSTEMKSQLVLWWPQHTGQKNPQAHTSFQPCSLVSMGTTELPRPRKANWTEEQSMPYRKFHYRRKADTEGPWGGGTWEVLGRREHILFYTPCGPKEQRKKVNRHSPSSTTYQVYYFYLLVCLKLIYFLRKHSLYVMLYWF